jgi:hypothetical protein
MHRIHAIPSRLPPKAETAARAMKMEPREEAMATRKDLKITVFIPSP